MEIRSADKKITGTCTGTAIMESGDRLSIAFLDKAGEYQVINLHVQGAVMVVAHEQTDDAVVVRRNSTQFVKGT